MSLQFVFILANSADLSEMLPYATFHLGLHCRNPVLNSEFLRKGYPLEASNTTKNGKSIVYHMTQRLL